MSGADKGDAIAREIGRLSDLPRSSLRDEWRRLLRAEPPNVSRDLLSRALTWEVQARAFGGLSRDVQRRLLSSDSKRAAPSPTPGTRYVREWRGEAQIVSVGQDGALVWNDQRFSSLSAVARAITGTRWSGPAFFGVRA